jgi:hypothetical protein
VAVLLAQAAVEEVTVVAEAAEVDHPVAVVVEDNESLIYH